MAYKGNNFIVKLDGTAIAGVRSNEIQSGADVIEVSSATQQQWREFIAGRREWSLNVSYLVMASTGLADLLTVGTMFTIDVTDRTGAVTASGTAILKVCKQTATRGNLVQGSFQFQGSGPLASVSV